MKYFSVIALIFLYSCFVNPEGRIVFYDFNSPKAAVEQKLFTTINADSSGGIFVEEGDKNVNAFEVIYVNFKNSPKETYQVGFTCDSMEWNHSPNSRLALIGVSDGKKWQFARDLNKQQMERMQQRFEAEVLLKLGESYVKSNETNTCAE